MRLCGPRCWLGRLVGLRHPWPEEGDAPFRKFAVDGGKNPVTGFLGVKVGVLLDVLGGLKAACGMSGKAACRVGKGHNTSDSSAVFRGSTKNGGPAGRVDLPGR